MSEKNLDRGLFSAEEIAICLADAQCRGLIEYIKDTTLLSDNGIDAAFDVWFKLSADDRFLLLLLLKLVFNLPSLDKS